MFYAIWKNIYDDFDIRSQPHAKNPPYTLHKS